MKEIKTEDAIGSVLCHDITEIVKDQRKGPRFKKGHIIKEEDIEVLLNLGKEHLYVFEKDETMIHENDAAEILCNLCFNEYMKKSAISEGKIELTSTIDGLFKVNREELFKVNSFGKMMIATRQGNVPVKKGDKLAGMRIIPLVIEKEKMQQIQEKIQKPILKIMPYQIKTAGIITTGSEVYKGRIKDTFTPVIVGTGWPARGRRRWGCRRAACGPGCRRGSPCRSFSERRRQCGWWRWCNRPQRAWRSTPCASAWPRPRSWHPRPQLPWYFRQTVL